MIYLGKTSAFPIKKEIVPYVKAYALSLFDELHKTMAVANNAQTLALSKHQNKLKEIKLRFALGKIEDECYSIVLDDQLSKIQEIENQMSRTNIELSNFNNRLENLVNIGVS